MSYTDDAHNNRLTKGVCNQQCFDRDRATPRQTKNIAYKSQSTRASDVLAHTGRVPQKLPF